MACGDFLHPAGHLVHNSVVAEERDDKFSSSAARRDAGAAAKPSRATKASKPLEGNHWPPCGQSVFSLDLFSSFSIVILVVKFLMDLIWLDFTNPVF